MNKPKWIRNAPWPRNYRLANTEFFISPERSGRKYSWRVLESGADPSGGAADRGWFDTLADAKAQAVKLAGL
jgi:hypothetical protein